jgi:nitroreductase
MDYKDIILKRESCRSFDGRPAEKEKILRCVDAARLAPSACNGQPWHFVIALSEEAVKTVREAVQGQGMNRFCDKCNSFVVVVEESTVLTSRIGTMITRTDFKPIDIGLAVSQFVCAATEQGLSTCILGWLNEKKIKEAFAVKKSHRVRLVIAVGYAATDAVRTKRRKTIEEICTIR